MSRTAEQEKLGLIRELLKRSLQGLGEPVMYEPEEACVKTICILQRELRRLVDAAAAFPVANRRRQCRAANVCNWTVCELGRGSTSTDTTVQSRQNVTVRTRRDLAA